jgi:hypothetical protein
MITSEKKRAAYEEGLHAGEQVLAGGATVSNGAQYWRDSARSLAEVIGCPVDAVVRQVVAYHQERLDAVPDLAAYPELQGYRDLLLEKERGMRDAGAPQEIIALSRTLEFWRTTRLFEQTGIAYYSATLPANCRILYMAESDRGALHLKNVDDPLNYWKPQPPIPQNSPWPFEHPLVFDGVSSGLHIDEIPPEIFPVDVHSLCREHCTEVDAAEEFMVKYNYFWRGQNLIIHDHAGNSVAFEKTSCRVATRGPNAQGINFVNEMGALDPGIAAHQRNMRQRWLDQNNWDWNDSPDGCAFIVYGGQWKNIARYVDELSLNPTWDNAKQLMEQRDPSGPMCLTGEKSHPGQVVAGCTLSMDIYEMDNKRLHRRQWRGSTPAYLDTPEIVQFV